MVRSCAVRRGEVRNFTKVSQSWGLVWCGSVGLGEVWCGQVGSGKVRNPVEVNPQIGDNDKGE